MSNSYSLAPLSCAARTLPRPLVQAKARVFDPHLFQDLSRLARMTLNGLLSFFNIRKLNQPVWPEREKLRQEAHIGSVTTLSRGLKELVSRGYVTRVQVKKWDARRHGQYAYCETYFAERTLVALQLISPPAPADTAPDNAQLDAIAEWEAIQFSTPNEALDYEAAEDLEALAAPSLYHDQENGPCGQKDASPSLCVEHHPDAEFSSESTALSSSPKNFYPQAPTTKVVHGKQGEHPINPQLFSREQPTKYVANPNLQSVRDSDEKAEIDPVSKLPTELIPLFDYGLNKSKIAFLMRQARENGKQGMLGAIWRIAKSRIDALTLRGSNAFKYLLALINKETDFAWVDAQRHQKQSISKAQNDLKQMLEVKCLELEGQMFRNELGTTVLIESNGRVRVQKQGDCARYGRVDGELLNAIASGRLRRLVQR